MPIHFVDGGYYEDAVEVDEEYLWFTAQVVAVGDELLLHNFLLYSASGTKVAVGYTATRTIFRYIEAKATEQGFRVLQLVAVRVKPGRPERMVSIRRPLP